MVKAVVSIDPAGKAQVRLVKNEVVFEHFRVWWKRSDGVSLLWHR